MNNRLSRLHDLAAFLTREGDLRTRLAELAERAAHATEAASCSIMLLSEGDEDEPRLKLFASTKTLPLAAWKETPRRGESIAGRVLQTGQPLVIADITGSQFAELARRGGSPGESFLCAPITVEGQIIGVINLSGDVVKPPFSESDVEIVGIVAALIGKSVQVDRLQTLLRSRIAAFAAATAEKGVVSSLMAGAMPPSRVAKLLAKTFYRDLAAANFEPGQIIEAASEILTLITGDVARAKKRLGKEAEQGEAERT